MSSLKNKRAQRHCFVPGCKTGCVKTLIKQPALFSAPKDEYERKCCEEAIQREDKSLDPLSSVCELLLTEDQLLRNYRHVINGQEVLIPRGRTSLVPGAIPSKFPDGPKHKRNTSRRKSRVYQLPPLIDDSPDSPPSRNEEKKRKLSVKRDKPTQFNHPIKLSDFLSVELPKYWTKIEFKNSPYRLVFAVWNNCMDSKPIELPKPSKMITVEEIHGDIACTIVIRGCINRKLLLSSATELTTILRETEHIYQ